MEIINEGWPNDNQVLLDVLKASYVQDNDCTECDEDGQKIDIETRDGGGGKFYHIKTVGWSFSNIEELVEIINDFIKRVQ